MPNGALNEGRKEQIKLRAVFLNNIGIGIMLIGVFTPIVHAMYEPASTSGDPISVIGTILVCFLLGVALHFTGSLILRGLNR